MTTNIGVHLSKEQLVQAFLRGKPNASINQPIQPNDLFVALNLMSHNVSNFEYDQQTFEELIERVQLTGQTLTVSNYLDVHILAVDVLNYRLLQLQDGKQVFSKFLQNLQSRIHELSANPQNAQAIPGFAIAFKQLSIKETIQRSNLNIRLFNEKQGIDQTLPFVNSNGFQSIILQNQQAPLESLDQSFQIEVFDEQTNFGFATLNLYQMNITYPKTVSIPLTMDSLPCNCTLNIEGFVSVENLPFAQEDFATLTQRYSGLETDILDTQEQLNGLNSPFAASGRPNQQPQVQGLMQSPQQHMNTYNAVAPYETNVNSQKPSDLGQSGDFSTQSLVNNIHYLLIGFLFAAIFFCLKRQMFLDVSISIGFLCVLYKIDLQRDLKADVILKLFTGLFVFSGCMDIAWFIVFFSSWNRTETSEDQGAQGIIRPIIIMCSLLFFVYKLVVIVAVFYFQNQIAGHAQQARRNMSLFLEESKAPVSLNNQNVTQQPQFQGQSNVKQGY